MTNKPYELLARFKADGTVSGVSVRHVTNVNGRDYENDPAPLSGATDPEFVAFADAFAAAAVSQRDQLLSEVDSLTVERDAAIARNQTLSGQVDALAAELDAIKNPPGPDLSTVDGAKQFITSKRFDVETAGFTVGDQFISTQRDEIGHWFPRYFNAMQWIAGDAATRKGNPDGIYPFKPKAHKPTVLSAVQVMRVYDCMTWYVNYCFAVEAQLYAMLDSGAPIADVLAMLPAAWPQSQFTWEPPTE